MKPKTNKGAVRRQPKKTIIPIKRAIKKKIIKKDYNKLFIKTLIEVSEEGKSIIAALKGKMSTQKFYELLEEDSVKAKRYAHACELRAEVMADELLTIADSRDNSDNTIVQRDKLRVDSRKWLLAKLYPKKYGDKVDMMSDGKSIMSPFLELMKSASQSDDKSGN